jgi:hypothetical protein
LYVTCSTSLAHISAFFFLKLLPSLRLLITVPLFWLVCSLLWNPLFVCPCTCTFNFLIWHLPYSSCSAADKYQR